jgi:hypothetical protein
VKKLGIWRVSKALQMFFVGQDSSSLHARVLLKLEMAYNRDLTFSPFRVCLEQRIAKRRKGKKHTRIEYRCNEKTDERKITGKYRQRCLERKNSEQ